MGSATTEVEPAVKRKFQPTPANTWGCTQDIEDGHFAYTGGRKALNNKGTVHAFLIM